MATDSPTIRLTSFIKEGRAALGLSQAKFAELVGMTQATFSRFESLGESDSIDPTKVAICEKALGLSDGYLYLVMGGFAAIADLLVSNDIQPVMRLIAEAGVESVSIVQIQRLVEVQKALRSVDADLTPSMIPDLIK